MTNVSEAEVERRVETAKALVRLEEKMDQCLAGIQDTRSYTHKLSERVRALEFFKYGVSAVMTFVLAVAGWFKFTGGH